LNTKCESERSNTNVSQLTCELLANRFVVELLARKLLSAIGEAHALERLLPNLMELETETWGKQRGSSFQIP